MDCIHALANVKGMWKHGADTQYGLSNYIAKYSLAMDEYNITQRAKLHFPGDGPYNRGRGNFPRSSKLNPDKTFTFEHAIPSAVIRKEIQKTEDKSKDAIQDILQKSSHVVIMMQAENNQIPSKYRSEMPDGWIFGADPYARYAGTSIVILNHNLTAMPPLSHARSLLCPGP